MNKFTRTIFSFGIFTIFNLQINAQETTSRTNNFVPKFGAKAGMNLANLSTENAKDNILVAFDLGLFAKLPVTKYFALQPEINFSMKGAQVEYNNPLVTGTAKYIFNYLEAPVLGVINLTDNFSILGGPYFAYLLSGSTKNDATGNVFDFENDINPDNYNRLDIGAAVGASLNIERIGLGIRYSRGLSTIGKESKVSSALIRFPDAINSVLNLNVAISF
jgi:hypothetical protein